MGRNQIRLDVLGSVVGSAPVLVKGNEFVALPLFRPFRLGHLWFFLPTAYALGSILAPLRGLGEGEHFGPVEPPLPWGLALRNRFWPPSQEKQKDHHLRDQGSRAVQQHVVETSGAAGNVALVPFVEARDQGSHKKRNSRPLN